MFEQRITTEVALRIRGAASQTASLLELQNSAAGVLAQVTSGGSIQTSANLTAGTLTALGRLTVVNGDVNTVGAVVRAANGQVSDVFQVQNNAGGNLFRVTPDDARFAGAVMAGNSGSGILATLTSYATTAATKGLVVRGAASQSVNLLEVQRSDAGSVFTVRNNGNFGGGSLLTGTNAWVNNDVLGASTIGMIVRGAASQTANLQEWQNSAGAILTRLDSIGNYFGDRLNIGGAVFGEVASPYFGKVNILQESGGHAIAMRGRDSQTTPVARIRMGATPGAGNNALLIENSAGSMQSQIGSNGNQIWLSGLAAVQTANGGATFEMTRMTAAVGNPGANIGRLYFRDGTNAGTLKLVVRAGAAGAETTILDNIPQ
jgi:hypothetical protein